MGEFLERILTYLYYTKYYEINIGHLDVQKHFTYKNGGNILHTGYQKRILLYCPQWANTFKGAF